MKSARASEAVSRGRAGWPKPTRFHTVAAPVFPVEMLAPWQLEFVQGLSNETQTPPDLAGSLVLSVCAAACAKKLEVEVRPGWQEPVNLNTLTSLSPGNRKSAVFAIAISPLEDFEQEEGRRVAPLIVEAEEERRILEQRLRVVESQIAKNKDGRGGDPRDEAMTLARAIDTVRVPVSPRLIADDCSPERLATLLRDHGGRMALLSPEGDIFDIIAGRYSATREPNLGVFLKGHAGDTLRVDRVNRPAEHIHRPALTIGLTVQPETLRGLAKRPTFRGRGLLARFLFSVPRSLLGTRKIAPIPMPISVRAAYRTAIHALLRLPFSGDEHTQDAHLLRLDGEADAELQKFEGWLEPQLGEFGELAGISDWAGKLAGAVVRIAGLLHAADHAGGTEPWKVSIPAETVRRAIRLGKYYLAHARVAFAEMGADPDIENAKYLLRWIGRVQGQRISQRDLFQGTKGRFQRVADMEPALNLLVEHNYLRRGEVPDRSGPGRPGSPVFEVNPYFEGDSEDSENNEDSEEGVLVSHSGNSENIEETSEEDTPPSPSTAGSPDRAPHNSQNPQNSDTPSASESQPATDGTSSSSRQLPCESCFGNEFWTLMQGSPICAECRPPTDPRIVREWIIDGEHLTPKEMLARNRSRSARGGRR